MQETPKTKTKKKTAISLGNVALLLIFTTLLGQVLGLLRTRLVNANFSVYGPQSTDAYFAAFNIPDFFYYTLSAGALGVAFMPVLSDRLQKGDRKGMWELSSSLMNLLGIIMLGVAVVVFVFARPLISHLVAPNFTPAQLNTAVDIMRLISLNPLFFTLSAILAAAQQTLGRFFFYSIASLFYNLSIIVSIYAFRHTSLGLVGLGIGALVGAILQLLVLVTGLIGMRFSWVPKILWRSVDFRMILRQLPARSIDQGIDQIENIVETNFARRLGPGPISYYNNASTLAGAPVMLLGTTIATAAFPRLNLRLSQGRPDLFRRDFLRILRTMIWLATPVVIIAYFARVYLARLIFSRNSGSIALILGFLSIAIFFQIIYTIVSRWFYAQKDTKTPLFVSLFVIALNIVLVATLSKPSAYGIAGLAIAQSIVALIEVVILSTVMVIRDHRLLDPDFWGSMVKILSVAGFSLAAGFIIVKIFPLQSDQKGFLLLGSKLVLITSVILGVYIAVSAVFGLEEAKIFFDRVKKIILKPIKIQY